MEEDRGRVHQIRGRLLTWETKVICFLKIWWRLNEAFFELSWSHYHWNEAYIDEERRFDVNHVDQGWNVCSPFSCII